MLRAITGFYEDHEGHWVAMLECGHDQHMRHKPPFVERPWVVSAAGRAAMVGHEIDCKLCDGEAGTGGGGQTPLKRDG
jgi:hypothetical protein